jgi:hypothetical protein
MKPANSKPVFFDKYYKSPWQLHYEKICKENPHLITNRERQEKANEEWKKKATHYRSKLKMNNY